MNANYHSVQMVDISTNGESFILEAQLKQLK